MEKTVFAIAAMLILFGCTAQGGLPENAPATPPYAQENQAADGQENGAGGYAPPEENTGGMPGQPQVENTGEVGGQPKEQPSGMPRYLATASIVQFSQKLRIEKRIARDDIRRWDNISQAYGISVDITDVGNGAAPLASAQNAKVSLIAPDGTEIRLPHGMASAKEYADVPSQGYFMAFNPAYAGGPSSTFQALEEGKRLPGGEYTIVIDVEGDGENDIEQQITVPGIEISSPQFGSEMQEGGFDLSWKQAGNIDDFIYRISFGQGFAGMDNYIASDDKVPGTTIRITPQLIDDEIEPGVYLLNFQAETGEAAGVENYYGGGKKALLQFAGSKEAQHITFKVGDFCHCDDIFLPNACTLDELYADPLCQ